MMLMLWYAVVSDVVTYSSGPKAVWVVTAASFKLNNDRRVLGTGPTQPRVCRLKLR